MRIALAVLLLAHAAQAPAQAPVPGYTMKQEAPVTGTLLKRETITGGALPFDKAWHELAPAHQALVRGWYEGMPPGDEPPYPLRGTKAIYEAIAQVQDTLQLRGALSMFVTVNAQGKGVEVSVVQSPDPELTRFIGGILLVEQYKPALCGGKPCTMQFPVRVRFN